MTVRKTLTEPRSRSSAKAKGTGPAALAAAWKARFQSEAGRNSGSSGGQNLGVTEIIEGAILASGTAPGVTHPMTKHGRLKHYRILLFVGFLWHRIHFNPDHKQENSYGCTPERVRAETRGWNPPLAQTEQRS